LLRRVIERMGDFLPRKPRPALLHGDLWSGNALAARTKDGVRIGVIDPAVYVGDAWADIAMMRMFGGFPPSCLDSYHAATNDTDGVEERVLVYQLYHMLNHLNLFGGGYKGSALGIAHRLVGR